MSTISEQYFLGRFESGALIGMIQICLSILKGIEFDVDGISSMSTKALQKLEGKLSVRLRTRLGNCLNGPLQLKEVLSSAPKFAAKSSDRHDLPRVWLSLWIEYGVIDMHH